LAKRISLALDFIHRLQREDGTFDFPSCNFKSAPDTSFCLKRLIGAYKVLQKYGENTESEMLSKKYIAIIKPALQGMMQGGFHTPNHRWGIAAALMQGVNLFKEDENFSASLRKRANQYLDEGIDCDENGEYAERSTGGYNAVVNTALITLYEETGNAKFLEYVRKNLEMMLTFLEPDDSIFTQNSTRQDKGKKLYADKYFYQYLYLADALNLNHFEAAAHKLVADNKARGDEAPDCLHILMNHERLQSYPLDTFGFLESYKKYYEGSGVLRTKTPTFTYSLLKGKSRFLFLQAGSTSLSMRIGVSYCDTRSFIPQTLVIEENKSTLTYKTKGWYYLPFENPPSTSDWWQMDHTKREILHNTELEIKVVAEELEDGLALHVSSKGLDKVPLRLELELPAGSVLENDCLYTEAAAGEHMILRKGELNIHHEGSSFVVGPGFGTHEFKGHYSGEEANTSGYSLFFNAYTPIEKTIFIKLKK
jgi:hypothetical protein